MKCLRKGWPIAGMVLFCFLSFVKSSFGGKPIPAFTVKADTACSGNATRFTISTSITYGYTFKWDWDGNGTIDYTTYFPYSVLHTYPGAGTYTAKLTVYKSGEQTTKSIPVIVNAGPSVANFTTSVNNLTVSLSNSSSNKGSSYWTFGDGKTSTDQNPVHVYQLPGTYQICLTESNKCGSNTKCSTVVVTCNGANALFSQYADNLDVQFTNNSTDAASVKWDFGDGETSTEVNPNHRYGASGNYSVCLYVSNFCKTDTFCNNISVTCTTPQGAFVDSVEELTAYFWGTSSTNNFSWTFGDGSSSDEQAPVHVYANTGLYNVCFSTWNNCDTTTVCKQIEVKLCNKPLPSFEYSGENVSYAFENTSVNSSSVFWNFGDGNSSSENSPLHTYADTGFYTVKMVSTNICGSDSISQVIHVTCIKPAASAEVNVSGQQVSFVNKTSDANSFFWDFGNGFSSADRDPVHYYGVVDTFLVRLIASNGCNVDTQYFTVITECIPPKVDFVYVTDGLEVDFQNLSDQGLTWAWNYGDNKTSVFRQKIHTYTTTGTYKVWLKASNSCTSDSVSRDIYVCTAPTARYVYEVDGLSVSFKDSSSQAEHWLYSFGDGATDTLPSPAHTYNTQGLYKTLLTVKNGCGSSNFSKTVQVYCSSRMVPELCLVSVDSSFSRNLLTWNPINNKGIVAYNIYRYDSLSTFSKIAQLNEGSTSSYLDTTADPAVKSYAYLITSLDSCGNESDSSIFHRTIHLGVSKDATGKGHFLNWNIYEGINQITTYRVMRQDKAGVWEQIAALGKAESSLTDTSFLARNGLARNYMIIAASGDSCAPEIINRKGRSIPRDSWSNKGKSIIAEEPLPSNGIGHTTLSGIKVYPNPAKDEIRVTSNLKVSAIELTDITGKTLMYNTESEKLNISSLSPGIYIIRVNTSQGVIIKRISKY